MIDYAVFFTEKKLNVMQKFRGFITMLKTILTVRWCIKKSYPQLSYNQIFWRLNVKLNLASYTEIKMSNLEQFPLIVNNYYELHASSVPKNLIHFLQSPYRTCEEVGHTFLSLISDAKKEKLNLSILSVYGTYDC